MSVVVLTLSHGLYFGAGIYPGEADAQKDLYCGRYALYCGYNAINDCSTCLLKLSVFVTWYPNKRSLIELNYHSLISDFKKAI